jgi:general secretion pathway protein J
MRRSRGFTLVEVLVALLILAIMAGLAWRSVDALLSSREVAQSHLDRSARLQTVLQQWEQDLLALQDSGVEDALSFDGASLRITRRQPAGMQVVAWSVREGQLLRWAGPVVQSVADLRDSYQRSQQFTANDSQRIMALDGVAGWQMYFYRGNSWSNAQSSGNTVATAASATLPGLQQQQQQQQQLPTGVRMVLEFGVGSGQQGRLTKTVLLGALQ